MAAILPKVPEISMHRKKFLVPAVLIMTILLAGIAAYSVSRLGPGNNSTCNAQSSSNQSNYIANGGFENRSSYWSLTSNNDTAIVTAADFHCGMHALELITHQNRNSSFVGLTQWTNLSGCSTAFERFGLPMMHGLQLSIWYKTLNESNNRFGITVTFHNSTSKLTILYLLAFKGVPQANLVDPNLAAGRVNVVINSPGPTWRQATFDLYNDFVKYFGVDPLARHYCVNYVALWQMPLSDNQGGMASVSYVPGSRSICFLDDVELRLVSGN
jgi:hypothetical protein